MTDVSIDHHGLTYYWDLEQDKPMLDFFFRGPTHPDQEVHITATDWDFSVQDWTESTAFLYLEDLVTLYWQLKFRLEDAGLLKEEK